VRTVEVEHVLESPQHWPPKEATPFSRRRRNFRTFSGQPRVREAQALVEFESARLIGKRTVIDQNLLPRNLLNQSDLNY
jgi:hypothetical protein